MIRRFLIAVGVALVGAVLAGPAAAAGPIDPERYSSTPTGWGWHFGASKATIDSWVATSGQRVTDIEVIGTNPMAFSATYVANTGTYARTTGWYDNETSASLAAKLAGKRLLDLETYVVNGSRRYAAVWVANTGASSKAWQWWLNATPSFIASKINSFGGRIVDIDRVSAGRYNVILLKNTGSDAKAWWWYYNVTPATIATKLKDNKARLVDIENEGNGRFTVSMVRTSGEYWYWAYGYTAAGVTELQAQAGMRIYDIERYTTSAGTRYAVLLINNVNSYTTKLRQIMWGPSKNAAFGFYLKRVDGSVLTALQERKVFEPASMIKALHHITALLAVQSGNASLDENVTWYALPSDPARYPGNTDYGDDKNKCAYNSSGTAITTKSYTDKLGDVILKQMMQQSDNRTTDAVYNRFGRSALNATAASLGMTQSQVYHRIGCPGAAAEVQPFKSNALTLRDDGLLFEAVTRASSPVLGTGSLRDSFFSLMSAGTSRFNTVVQQEAASLGKSNAVANSFIANMRGGYKPGGYTNGAGTCNSTGCTKLLVRSTGGGYLALPFKVAGAIERRGYVYGNFVDGTFDCGGYHTTANPRCQPQIDAMGTARGKQFEEMLRPQIRAALQTW